MRRQLSIALLLAAILLTSSAQALAGPALSLSPTCSGRVPAASVTYNISASGLDPASDYYVWLTPAPYANGALFSELVPGAFFAGAALTSDAGGNGAVGMYGGNLPDPLPTTYVLLTSGSFGSWTVLASTTIQACPSFYAWSGFTQPINSDGSSIFKLGSTVPVKFSLPGTSAPVSASFSAIQSSSAITGSDLETGSTAAPMSGSAFRYDNGTYIYNWKTKGLERGSYAVQATLDDGSKHSVTVSLR